MRTHTTLTDIKRVMKAHEEGYSAEEISNIVFVHQDAVQHIIDVKFPAVKKKAAPKKKAAAKKVVDPLS